MDPRNPDLNVIYRKNIFSLKPGTLIPGYTGHRPGVRFGFGNTYGDLTYQLNSTTSKEPTRAFNNQEEYSNNLKMDRQMTTSNGKISYENPKNDSSAMIKLLQGLDLDMDDLNHCHHPAHRQLYKRVDPPTGLKSGYTGYVPRLRFHYGSSYNSSANEARKEFSQLQQVHRKELEGSLNAILCDKYDQQAQKHLIPVNDNDKVLEELLKFEELQKSKIYPNFGNEIYRTTCNNY